MSRSRVTVISIDFRNYKAFPEYSIALHQINVLVGPNNAGKSTVLGAIRALETMMRTARRKSAEAIEGPSGEAFGYYVNDEALPISVENIHTNLSDQDTTVTFNLSNGNKLQLYFPQDGGCALFPLATNHAVRSPTVFRNEFPLTIVAVPVLGPVEHHERLVQQITVQRNVETHLAPRHFRSYWHYKRSDEAPSFGKFNELIAVTWPGMVLEKPELTGVEGELRMFVREQNMTRELFWSGSGFQVWCQLLTHICRAENASIFIVDEPEVYLHPDLQRQLITILLNIGADVVLATHSSEIIGEAEPSEIVLIDKKLPNAQRLHDVVGVQKVLDGIGSVQNIALAKLARNKALLFVEGEKDYAILRGFAKILGLANVAAGSTLAVAPSGGASSWRRIRNLGWGLKKAIGEAISIGAIYDRDYLSDEEIAAILSDLGEHVAVAHFHNRKEIENYLLAPKAIQKAAQHAIAERNAQDRIARPAAARHLRADRYYHK